MKKYDVIVIGAGPGGYSLAAMLSSNNKKTALIEKDKLGGTCVNYGCIPTKSILTSARVIESLKTINKHSVSIDNYTFDVNKLTSNAINVSKTLNNSILNTLTNANVDIYSNVAKLLDENTILLNDNTKLSFDKLVIATGSRNRYLNIENIDSLIENKTVLDTTDILHLDSIPKSITIIGSGAIALELGYYLSVLGTKVTLLEYAPIYMPLYDRDVADEIKKMLDDRNIEIHTNVRFIKFSDTKLYTTINGVEKIFDTQKYLVAAGRVANIEGFENIIDLNERNFIKVNKNMQTNISHIYAMGDVTGIKMSSTMSYKHGDTIAQHILGLEIDEINPQNIPSALYLNTDISTCGLSEKNLNDSNIEYEKIILQSKFMPANHATQDIDYGFIKLLLSKNREKLLGCAVILKNSSLIINTLSLAISGKTELKDLFSLGHTHPTVSESMYYALRNVFLKK